MGIGETHSLLPQGGDRRRCLLIDYSRAQSIGHEEQDIVWGIGRGCGTGERASHTCGNYRTLALSVNVTTVTRISECCNSLIATMQRNGRRYSVVETAKSRSRFANDRSMAYSGMKGKEMCP